LWRTPQPGRPLGLGQLWSWSRLLQQVRRDGHDQLLDFLLLLLPEPGRAALLPAARHQLSLLLARSLVERYAAETGRTLSADLAVKILSAY
ncbi:hypothetical protein Q6325_27455, partial [Klebsiella pneumoniae]|uniref:hypothetical protein n=1 Tax=Klebsiella pneumoniae TaxID=573 RepID=UPI002731A5C7